MLWKHYLLLLAAGLLFLGLFASPSLVCAQDAAETIALARQQIAICYNAANEAELAGANVTSLTALLNEAGALLSKAELASSLGDFYEVRSLVLQCHWLLSGFAYEATGLQASGEQARKVDFLLNTVGPVVGAFAVVGFGVWVWVYLKKHFGKEAIATAFTRL